MRTILAILAALAIATAARAETEALVTDPSNNVISSRAGALVFSNEISSATVSFVNGESFANYSGIFYPEFNAYLSFEEQRLAYGQPLVGATVFSWDDSLALDFGNAAGTRTNIGLGGTNAPTFAGLTLTTLTNATPRVAVIAEDGTVTNGFADVAEYGPYGISYNGTPCVNLEEHLLYLADGSEGIGFGDNVSVRTNLIITTLTNATGPNLVLASTDGQLSTGSVPSGAAPLGAALQADGSGSSAFVASRYQFSRVPTNSSRANWTNNDWNFATNNELSASVVLDANSIYRIGFQIATDQSTAGFAYTLATTTNLAANQQRNGYYNVIAGQLASVGWQNSTAIRGDGGGQTLNAWTNVAITWRGGAMVVETGTNQATLYIRWWPTVNTNVPVSLTTNSYLYAEKLWP